MAVEEVTATRAATAGAISRPYAARMDAAKRWA